MSWQDYFQILRGKVDHLFILTRCYQNVLRKNINGQDEKEIAEEYNPCLLEIASAKLILSCPSCLGNECAQGATESNVCSYATNVYDSVTQANSSEQLFVVELGGKNEIYQFLKENAELATHRW
jgi:hypothetical protein